MRKKLLPTVGLGLAMSIVQGRDLSAGTRSLEAPLLWNRVHTAKLEKPTVPSEKVGELDG